MKNPIDTITDRMRAAGMRPWRIARHPETGLYHAIDRTLRSPITEGYETESGALEAWYLFEARAALCTADSRRDLDAQD